MLQHWIWLATRQSVPDTAKLALLERFCDPERIYYAEAQELSPFSLTAQALESLADRDLSEAEQILRECTRKKIRVLTVFDGAYPAKLRNIPDPPVVLYCLGQLPDLDALPSIGVVGTRKASAYGLMAAEKLGYQLASCGAVVVSGMARGIDAMAMKGALSAGGGVIGVLGCGVDVVYPRENGPLFEDTRNFGCILSEYPPQTKPLPYHFPHRNRIISGLSDGVLVVEAPKESGALITARQAADQGRDVFVIPANIGVTTGEGSNALLREGALAVSCGWDVAEEYAQRYPGKIRQAKPAQDLSVSPETELSAAKKDIDNSVNGNYIDLAKLTPSLSEQEQAVVRCLSSGRKPVDDVIADSGLPAEQILPALTMLEIRSIVRRLPGGFVCLAYEE